MSREQQVYAFAQAGPERDERFQQAVRMNSGWTRFRDRAGERQIPVLRLTPSP